MMKSNIEAYLQAMINDTGTNGLPTPKSRIGKLLYVICGKLGLIQQKVADVEMVANTQANWEQGNETAIDYVKGRTHYISETLINQASRTLANSSAATANLTTLPKICKMNLIEIPAGQHIYVYVDGNKFDVNELPADRNATVTIYESAEYTVTCKFGANTDRKSFDLRVYCSVFDASYAGKEFRAELVEETIKTLDEKFIPDVIARKTDIVEQIQSNWGQSDATATDYVKNRTHYDDEIQIDTFVWDGNSEGRIVVPQGDSGIFYTKISDVMPTLDDCSKGGTVVRTYPDGRSTTATVTAGTNANGIMVIANCLAAVPEELVGVYFENDDCTFPESGLYGIGSDGVSPRYEISITGFTGFNERVLKKLDPKFLPNGNTPIYVSDNRLYHDEACTQKVSAAELDNMIFNGGVTLNVDGYLHFPLIYEYDATYGSGISYMTYEDGIHHALTSEADDPHES